MRTEQENPIYWLTKNVASLLDKVDEIENRLQALEGFCDNKHGEWNTLYRNITWSNKQLVMQIEDFQQKIESTLGYSFTTETSTRSPRKAFRHKLVPPSEFTDALIHLRSDDIFHHFNVTERCIFGLRLQGMSAIEIAAKIGFDKTSVHRHLRTMARKAGCADFDELEDLWQQKIKGVNNGTN
jgi:DNA-binding CsgD family transcriptional regulator